MRHEPCAAGCDREEEKQPRLWSVRSAQERWREFRLCDSVSCRRESSGGHDLHQIIGAARILALRAQHGCSRA